MDYKISTRPKIPRNEYGYLTINSTGGGGANISTSTTVMNDNSGGGSTNLKQYKIFGQEGNYATREIKGDLKDVSTLIAQDASISNTLKVGGTTNLKGNTDIDGNVDVDGTMTVSGDFSGTSISLSGDIDADNANISNTLTANDVNCDNVNCSDTITTHILSSDSISNKNKITTKELDASTIKSTTINNTDTITTKNLEVTGSAHFFELIIDSIRSVGGACMFTPADGFVIDKVNPIIRDQYNRYRLFWKNTDDNGNYRANMWQSGDQALCMSFNQATTGQSSDVSNKYYWCYVPWTSNDEALNNTDYDDEGYNFIDIIVDEGGDTKADGTVNPEIGDNIVMCGHRQRTGEDKADAERRGSAIYIASYAGLDSELKAPFIAQYRGVKTFDLAPYRKSYFDATGAKFIGNFEITPDQLTEIANQVDVHDPYIDGNGYWVIWKDGNWFTTDIKAQGNNGLTPYIQNGTWWIGNTDTGVKAQGTNGVTPTVSIGSNGNWFINGVDTGKTSKGDNGQSPYISTSTGTWWEYNPTSGKYEDTGIKASGNDAHSPQVSTSGTWLFWDDSQKKYIDSGQSVAGDDGHSPYIGTDGFWYEWDDKTNQYKKTDVKAEGQDGDDGLTPYIKNGTWWIGNTDTGITAQGNNGLTPRIVNGYWWIGDTNTGVKATGDDGLTPRIVDGYWWIGNTNTGIKAEGQDGNDAPQIGRNLVLKSDIKETFNTYGLPSGHRLLSVNLEEGKKYTLSANGYIDETTKNTSTHDRMKVFLYEKDWNANRILDFDKTTSETKSITFTCSLSGEYYVNAYYWYNPSTSNNNPPTTPSGKVTLNWVKLEEGEVATTWSLAPEDTVGPKGDNGVNGTYREYLYTASATKPSKPTYIYKSAISSPWSVSIPDVSGTWTSYTNSTITHTGDSVDNGGGEYKVPGVQNVHNEFVKGVIRFTTTHPKEKITVQFKSISENNYDWCYLGNLDTDYTSAPSSYKARLSGSGSYTDYEFEVEGSGSHYIEVIFTSDGSQDVTNEGAYYKIKSTQYFNDNQKVWFTSNDATWNDNQWTYLAHTWTEPQEYMPKGADGQNGQNANYHTIEAISSAAYSDENGGYVAFAQGAEPELKIDGVRLSNATQRGLTAFTIDPTSLTITHSQHQDVYSDQNTTTIRSFINSYSNSNNILVLISRDALWIDELLINSLKSHGLDDFVLHPITEQQRAGLVFIGQKDMNAGSAYCSVDTNIYTGGVPSRKVKVTAQLSCGQLVNNAYHGLKGDNGDNGDDAEFYRLYPVTENAVISQTKSLSVNLQYIIQHIKGGNITSVTASSSGYWIRFKNNTSSTYTTLSYTSSPTYYNSNYTSDGTGYQYLTVQLMYGSNTVVDQRTVNIILLPSATFSIKQATDTEIASISSRVTGTETNIGTLNNQMSGIEQTATRIESTVSQYSSLIAGDNYFGFNKGVKFGVINSGYSVYVYPCTQAYGFELWSGNFRMSNLGFNGAKGVFTVSFDAMSTGQNTYLNVNLCDVKSKEYDAKKYEDDTTGDILITRSWKHFDLTFNVTSNSYTTISSYNGFLDWETSNINSTVFSKDNKLLVKNLCIVKGDVPKKFAYAQEDINGSFDNYRSDFTVNPSAIKGTDGVISSNYIPTSTTNYYDYVAMSNVTVKAMTPYTLVFKAKSGANGTRIHSYMYEKLHGEYTYTDGNDNIVKISAGTAVYPDFVNGGNGDTVTDLTTEWKTYFIHWYSQISQKLSGGIIVARKVYNEAGYTSTIYVKDPILYEGYVSDVNVHSQTSNIIQTANEIKLSVTDGLQETGIDITHGKILLNADNTIVNNNLTVGALQTSGSEATLTINDGTMKVFGNNKLQPNIVFGIDEDGYAVLSYYNNEGKLLYNLGPDGILQNISETYNKFAGPYKFIKIDNGTTLNNSFATVDIAGGTSYYRFTEGYKMIGSVKQYKISSSNIASVYNLCYYKSNDLTLSYIQTTSNMMPNGWYLNGLQSPTINNNNRIVEAINISAGKQISKMNIYVTYSGNVYRLTDTNFNIISGYTPSEYRNLTGQTTLL